jgi:general secretion pathway protein D
MKIYKIIILIVLSTCFIFPQQELEKRLSGEYSPLELVSITKFVSFDQAIKMLSAVSELVTGKSIVSTVIIPSPINVEIIQMPYLDALNLIVNVFDLTYDVKETSIIIREKSVRMDDDPLSDDIWADIDAREIKIAAIFFEADVENSREVGIDWSVLLSGNGINLGTELRTQSIFSTEIPGRILKQSQSQSGTEVEAPGFDLGSLTDFTTGEFTGTATAIFRFFESKNLGEIIASPNITVRNGQKGRIQIGEDFSIKQRDFSGNIIDRFYSAGTIIEVTPYVYKKNNIDYILVKLNAERSSFLPTEVTTVVKKTQATSDVLMLNGEETVIGGLYINEETTIRNGIPFLKDLPWWVFGIRYLTGSDQKVVRKKEVVIVLRVELLPTLEERARRNELRNKDLIRYKIMDDQQEIRDIKPDMIQKEK